MMILYFTPHQDDETLTLGSSISNHINAGHTVHVVLCTEGVNSGVRPSTGLSRPSFTAARDDEFRRATRQLGVRADRIHISRQTTQDGQLSVAAARDVITDYLEQYPGAWVKTHTNLPATGRHADHVNLGTAAAQLHSEGVITNLRLYVEPYELDDFRAANPSVSVAPERTTTPERVRAAIDQYQVINKPAGMYGIGYQSTPAFFDLVDADPTSYYHAP